MERKLEKLIGVASGAATLATLSMALRPLFLNWGATDEEAGRTWPGDELAPTPASLATRAVTIHAPADVVWPWILQIGQDRGGFYSYTWLENLFGAHMHNVYQIMPEWQSRKVGDTMWMTPSEKYGGKGCMRVARLDPGRAMVLVSPDDYDSVVTKGVAPHGVWTFILDPVDDRTTRLILRSRSGPKEGPLRFLVFDPAHFIMERKMMLTIRDLAEVQAAWGMEVRAA